MRNMKRILCMALALLMIVGLLPMNVLATEETVLDAAIFCSDVHGSESDLEAVLGGIKTSGVDYSSIGFVGDTCLTVANTTSIVQSALSDTDIAVMFSYAASHDTEDGADISTNWNYSGEVENVSDYYLVYTIRETDMQNDNGAEADFTTWYNGLTAAQKKLPIFIMSHRPLHDRRDDNAGAASWYDAISAAAESSDIVFFWAHNHTSESSVDTAAYYVAKDGTESFTVYNGDTVVPNFTYMNAGYINANNQNPGRINVATTVQITADSLIFQDYNSSGEYSGTHAHNVTVEREFASTATLESLSVKGEPTYYVGGEGFKVPTITATYSDNSTKTLQQSDCEVTGSFDMTVAGNYSLTYTYEGKSATYSFAVLNPYVTKVEITTEPNKLAYVTDETLDTTGLVLTATYNTGATAVVTPTSFSGYDLSVEGEQTVTVNYYDNGATYSDTYNIVVEKAIAADAVLEKIEIVTDPEKLEYLLSEPLNITGMVVVATFSDGSTKTLSYGGFASDPTSGDFYYTITDFNMHVEKAQTVVVSYTYNDVTCTDTFVINVWAEDFTDEDTGVKVHVSGDYGVTDADVVISTNTNVSTAIAAVIRGTNYKAYDISLVFNEGYSETDTTKTVTLPIPSGVSNPVVYYVSDDGQDVEFMNATKDGNGNVTFETTHFSTYVIGESTEITVPDNQTQTNSSTITSTTTTTKTVYVLTTSISSGNSYLIANSATAGDVNLVANDGGDLSNTSATVKYGDCDGDGDSEYYIELTDATNELWTVSNSYRFENQDEYLRCSNGSLSVSSQSTTWSYSSNRLSCTSSSSGGGNRPGQGSSGTTYYLRYNNGWTVTSTSSSASSIYFYVPTEVEVEVDTSVTKSGTYTIEGEDLSVAVSDGSTADLTSTLTFTPDENNTAIVESPVDVSTTATYEIVTMDKDGNEVDGDPNDIISKIENGVVTFTGNYGKALVKVSYETEFGTVTDYITITATAPYYTIQLHEVELEEATGVTAENFADGTYYYKNETTGFYHIATEYVDGTTYYVNNAKQGEEITDTVVLKGVEAGDTYSVWAVVEKHTSAGAEDMGELGDALHWTVSDTSIARIDEDTGVITFTGTNYGTIQVTVSYEGDDGKVITDTITISVTESLYVVPGDGTNDFPEYPNEGAVRFDKTATAVGNFSETGIAKVELSMTGVPYTTGNAIDALLVLDMSTSMKTSVGEDDDGNSVTRYDVTAAATKAFIKTIVQNDDGTYNNNTVCVHYFNGTTAYTDAITSGFITISSDAELEAVYAKIDALMANPPSTSGTDYSTSMEAAYDAIIARDAVSDNTQALVFMSDGGPTYYTYVNGDSYGTVSNDASTIVGWFETDNNDTTDDETDDTATPNSNFKNEYYSTLLKNAGYPVYTVGLGLAENSTGPSAFTGLTSGAHEAITSYILSSMATNASYFYNVADEDAVANMGNIFSGIAASIKEAATDVVVEDKIGNNYSINFDLPEGITSDATDGIEDFYIQVVDYVLDSTTHERTGVYTVLENFTFDGETGALTSHTVDGVACSNCTHVTTDDNGAITAIDGTYFDYKSDSTGEYLTWKADKLTSTELALQYFAYLDDSAGEDVQNQIPAGTYYTNEYATLTYTNFQGNQVQQEFPIPQMTWNGAQVSYVFYLVNEQGQPVNRAGKVVPMAEAVYVTDIFTYSIIWNDLEQAAGLEAEYLAVEKLPDAYELYDDDASYYIHVYEKETEVNLNNHFVIGGDVTDEYNTVTHSWTNAKTTYVFNNKSDTTKYQTVGAYVADDGDTTANETGLSYFCKSAIIEGATYTTSVENDVTVYTVTSVGNGYQSVTGETQATVAMITAVGGSTTGGTVIGDYIYYVDENGDVYTIVQKSDGIEVEAGFDFANTTVAFAVVWKPELKEDTVVVDFGLDVIIDVTTNDNMAAGVVGVRTDAPSNVAVNSGTYDASKNITVDLYIDANNDTEGLKELKIGTATVESLTSVRFSLDKTNGMQFTDPVVFYYESDVNYYNDDNVLQTTSMYSKVTVIPATTVYYEDSFVTLTTETKGDSGWTVDTNSTWTSDGSTANKTQDCDRPGADKIGEGYDADNLYGYDSAYESMSKYSLGSAAMVNVYNGHRAKATFEFYGTGFDVISLTSNKTGTIMVSAYAWDANTGAYATSPTKSFTVDTYYGYTKNTDGEWVTTVNEPNALYQVPVMKMSGLTYGKYKVEIVAAYGSLFDHDQYENNSYDFYLDAIRIYDPTGVVSGSTTNDTDGVVSGAYEADGEGWPTYRELRNLIISKETFDSLAGDTVEGVVFIDGENALKDVTDYTNYGPNNELYLAAGQAIVFDLTADTKTGYDLASVQLAIKTVDGSASVKVYSVDPYGNILEVAVGTKQDNKVTGEAINTATDMYYDITNLNNGTVIIVNDGTSGIVSLTNIKFTYEVPKTTNSNEGGTGTGVNAPLKSALTITSTLTMLRTAAAATEELENTTYLLSVSADTVASALVSLNVEEEEVEPETPEEPTEPEVPETPEEPAEPEKPEKPEDHKKPGKGHGKHNGKHHREYFDDQPSHHHGRRGH